MKSIILFLLVAWAAMAQSEEFHFDVLHTVNGRTITNATVRRMNASYVIADYAGGGERIAFTNLSPAIQKQFGFDPAKAQAELELQQQRNEEAQQRRVAMAQAQQDARQNAILDKTLRWVDGNAVPISDFQLLNGPVSVVLNNGILMVPYETVQVVRSRGIVTGLQSIGAYSGGGGGSGEVLRPGTQTVFVRCPVRGIVTGANWTGLCYRNGMFKLTENQAGAYDKYDTGLSYLTKSDVVLKSTQSILPNPRTIRSRN
jgi:hypothetical protein